MTLGVSDLPGRADVEITKHHVDLLTGIFTTVRTVGIGSCDAAFK